MYHTHKTMQLFAVIFISTIIAIGYMVVPLSAHASTIRDRIESQLAGIHERICTQLERAFAQFPVPVALPAFCVITPPPPPPPTTGHLMVNKITQPSEDTTTFNITASGSGAITGGGAGEVTDATDKNYEVAPGTYSVLEAVTAGWTIVGNTCTEVVVLAGETKTCIITNAKLPTLTLTKQVVNNGSNTTQNDFQAKIDGANVPWGVAQTLSIGAHTASETVLAHYTASDWGTDCAANGTITLAAGEAKTCSVTNTENLPAQGALLITEVLYDVAAPTQGAETTNEWVEIHNGTNAPIDLTGYTLADNTSSDPIPSGTIIPSGGILVFTPGTDTATLWGIPAEKVVVLAGTNIGNGLGTNDNVRLLNASAVLVDGVSWGTNIDPLSPGAGGVDEGSSLARTPMTTDTNTAADWVEDATPTPGL